MRKINVANALFSKKSWLWGFPTVASSHPMADDMGCLIAHDPVDVTCPKKLATWRIIP